MFTHPFTDEYLVVSNFWNYISMKVQLCVFVRVLVINLGGLYLREEFLSHSYILYIYAASGKESACQWRRCRRCKFNLSVRKIPWSRKWQHAPVFLPRKFQGQTILVGYSPWSCKESNTTEHTHTHTHTHSRTYLWASQVAQLVKNPPAVQETLVRFLNWEDPLENK